MSLSEFDKENYEVYEENFQMYIHFLKDSIKYAFL